MSRQPRFKRNEWVKDKQMDAFCQIRSHAQANDKQHMYNAYAPGSATWFTAPQSDFRKVTRLELMAFLELERQAKKAAWDRLLFAVREQARKEKERG